MAIVAVNDAAIDALLVAAEPDRIEQVKSLRAVRDSSLLEHLLVSKGEA